MSHKVLYSTAAASVIVASGALIYSPISAQDTSTDTADAIKSAAWHDNVEITMQPDTNSFKYKSNGVPSHGFAPQYLIPSDPADQPFKDKPAEFFGIANSAEDFTESAIETTITTRPVYTDATTDTSLGMIGVAINGARIFNDYEDFERAYTAQDDQVVHNHVAFLDNCNGHTLVDGTNYHYHGIPVCMTEAAAQPGEHSIMIGVLTDGFPVYANNDIGGIVVTNDDLDECSGHFGPTPEFPDGIYHYHLTADEAPYMIDCYHGEVDETQTNGQNGDGPDFAAAADELGVTEAALKDALGTAMPPDFGAAAQALGVSEDALTTALPAPGR